MIDHQIVPAFDKGVVECIRDIATIAAVTPENAEDTRLRHALIRVIELASNPMVRVSSTEAEPNVWRSIDLLRWVRDEICCGPFGVSVKSLPKLRAVLEEIDIYFGDAK